MRSAKLSWAVVAAVGIGNALAQTGADTTVNWYPCPEGSPPNLDCGEITVPLNWTEPDGPGLVVRMNRVNATNSADRIGSLIFNPGGPGASATEVCLAQALGLQPFNDALAQRFDIICPDPRGVGLSTPIVCNPEIWSEAVSLLPTTEAEFEDLVHLNRRKGESCNNTTGARFQHADTTSVARDFEAIRVALDDGPLSYLGLSYGSFIGTTYAELYPENIRAMAIDGILDHSQSASDMPYTESLTYENELNRWFEWCASNTSACGLIGEDLPALFDNLTATADGSPIPAPACLDTAEGEIAGTCHANVTGEDIRFAAQVYLLSVSGADGFLPSWSDLGFAMNQTIVENNATLFSINLPTAINNATYPATAVACLDFDRIDISNMTRAFTELRQRQILGSAFNRHLGIASQTYTIQASCVGWPVEVINPQRSYNQTALQIAPPILMVNAEHDPSTSYAWALGVYEQIPNAVLVTRQGDGHTSYFDHGEASGLIDSYLVNLTLPELGTVAQS